MIFVITCSVVVLIGIMTVLVHGPLSVFMFGVLVVSSSLAIANKIISNQMLIGIEIL